MDHKDNEQQQTLFSFPHVANANNSCLPAALRGMV